MNRDASRIFGLTRCLSSSLQTCLLLNQKISMRRFTLAQLKKESTLDRPLFAIDGNVYDMTDFVDTHPGKLLDCS